jgi:hypothetical protein
MNMSPIKEVPRSFLTEHQSLKQPLQKCVHRSPGNTFGNSMLEVHLTTPNQLVYILSNSMANIANGYESERTENKATVRYCKPKTHKPSIVRSCTSVLGYITPISGQSSIWRAQTISTSSSSITKNS